MRRVSVLFVAAASALSCSAMSSSEAISRLLNSRAAGSPKAFAEAAEVVAKDAAAGRPLQQFLIAVVADDPSLPASARPSQEVRSRYLAASRDRIRALAESKGNALAWYLLSLERNDLKMLKRAVDGGNIQALNAWGTITLTKTLSGPMSEGEDLDRVVERSFTYFKRAAEQKDANGFYNLGMCYFNGYGCKMDKDKAFDCFRTAAEDGHPEAINNIGGLYRDGVVVEQDPVIATKWFAKSAALGNAYGLLNYALALQRGEGIAKDEKRAAELLCEAARKGLPEAMNAYAMCMFYGTGVAKDHRTAVAWYRRAANEGFAPAMENLAICYDLGTGGLEKSAEEATVWKVRSRAARGDRNAMAWLSQNGYGMK